MKKRAMGNPKGTVTVSTYWRSGNNQGSPPPTPGKVLSVGISMVNFDEIKHLLSDKPLRRPNRKPSK